MNIKYNKKVVFHKRNVFKRNVDIEFNWISKKKENKQNKQD